MRFIATLFGAGDMRPAPGTWGTVMALALAYPVAALFGFWVFAALTVAAFFLGWWITERLTRDSDDHDPSWIVIDELVGLWIALWPVIYGAGMMNVALYRLYPGWISAFVLFRLFDIWKPWLVGRADRMGTALGVMLDDVIAGVFAVVITVALAALSHGLLM